MPKIVGTRERVHQPFYDSLIRTDGAVDLRGNQGANQLSARTQLFLRSGADISVSNLTTGGTFPSDQTFITLAVRVWCYFRFNPEQSVTVNSVAQSVGSVPGVFPDRIMRVHKLYHQSQNQLFWQFQAGDKPQLTTFTAYTPFAGGLDGFFAGSGIGSPGAAGGGSDPFLGSAANFTVLAASGVTNTGATVIQGNMGSTGGAAFAGTGWPPGTVTGLMTQALPVDTTAQTDLGTAVVALNGLANTGGTVGPNLTGLTLPAGVYDVPALGQLPVGGVLTLDGGGNANARFVFRLASSLTLNNGSSIVLINGARAHNVYFVAASAIVIGTTVTAVGNMIAQSQVTFANASTLVGRALAQTANVTFINNQLQLDPFDPVVNPVAGGYGGANGNSLPRANNGVPTSSALMRLARPILIPPRQGFQCIATLSAMGQASGSSLLEQLLGQVDGSVGPASIISAGQAAPSGDLTLHGADSIEKDVKYLIDGIHSRDVL